VEGDVALVTGATGGIGLETARALVARGLRVLLVARDPAKGERAVAEIGGGEVLTCDLERPASVAALAREVRARTDRLDVLVDNAGAMFSTRQVTPDGFERTWALDHLAYFVLTTRLLDLLRAGAPSRVVVVASDAHRGGKMHWDDLQMTRWTAGGWPAYAQAKLANLLFAQELARRLDGTGTTVNAVHPGFVASGFARNNGWLLRVGMALAAPFARSPAKGADTVIWAATDPSLEETTGRYFADRREITPIAEARDEAAAKRLWELTEAQVAPLVGA
jgi:NAD(P)-dependent dehydrogenase (short-subunit alcohol dehydrogenase family)